jgi:MFS family permease
MPELEAWDPRYEKKSVLLLCLGFGLVGFDRFMILPLFPVMKTTLHLSYGDLGIIIGVLSIAWGASSIMAGRLADRFGRRRVLVISLLCFSLLAGFTGLAGGLAMLLVMRAVMGFAEGAFAPASIVATIEAARPDRQASMLGLQQAALPLFGLTLAPILVTQLLGIISWKYTFLIVIVPGLLVAYGIWKTIRSPSPRLAATHTAVLSSGTLRPGVLRYRNIRLNIAGMFCWGTSLTVLGAMMPSYLIDHLHYGMKQMGFVLSASGLGACLGTVALLTLSDWLGRKPVMLIGIAGAFVSLYCLSNVTDPSFVFLFLLAANFFNFGVLTLTAGPLSAESVPASLMASASGLVVGVGEIFGGGIAPIIVGFSVSIWGIDKIFFIAMAALGIGFCVAMMLTETRPKRRSGSRDQSAGSTLENHKLSDV